MFILISSVNIMKPDVAHFGSSLETRLWPLIYTPLPAVFSLLCPSMPPPHPPSLNVSVPVVWKPSLISQLYIYLRASTLLAFPAA